jgi:hypothetical protein
VELAGILLFLLLLLLAAVVVVFVRGKWLLFLENPLALQVEVVVVEQDF